MLVSVPVDLAGTKFCWIIGFLCFALMSYLHYVFPSSSMTGSPSPLQFPDCITCYPPVPRLHHVLPSSSQTVSRTTLQFPDCITCYHPVPRLHHVLPSSSQTVSRATLKFQNVSRAPHIHFGDTWRGKLSLFSPFVTFIDFTLSTDIYT